MIGLIYFAVLLFFITVGVIFIGNLIEQAKEEIIRAINKKEGKTWLS